MRAQKYLVVLLFLLLASACTRTQPTNEESVIDRVRSSHRLKAAYVVYPPFVIKDSNSGKLSGYFIDLMSEIAFNGQFQVDYEEAKWGTMVAGLESKRYDIVVSGIFPTIPRSFAASFARPIMYVGLSAVVPATDTRQWTADTLKNPGLRIAVVNGEVGHEYLKRYLPNAQAIVLDTADISRAALEVLSGRADVAIAESITMVEFAAANPKVKALFVENPLQVFGSTFMIRRGDPDWLNFINTSIDFLEASGSLRALDTKYKSYSGLWRDRTLPWK